MGCLPDGEWLPWLDREFGWGEAIAQRFMQVAIAFGSKSLGVSDLSDCTIDAGALYMISAPDAHRPKGNCRDAVAAISKVLAYQRFRYDLSPFAKFIADLGGDAAENIWGNIRKGEGPGERCILDVTPKDAFTRSQVRIALGVRKDSGRMAAILADARERARISRIAHSATVVCLDARAVIASANLARRDLSKGQQATALAVHYPEPNLGGARKRGSVSETKAERARPESLTSAFRKPVRSSAIRGRWSSR